MLDVVNMNSYSTQWPEFSDCNFEAQHAALNFHCEKGELHSVPEAD